MNTWKQKPWLTQADLTSEPSANLVQERSPIVRYLQEAATGEQSHPLELDKQMRSRMERQFGLDFSAVRLVESDLPGKLGADAVAQGDLIRFAPGAFHPETTQGERLLSHELSHVVQQSRGQGMGGVAGMPWVDVGTESGADAMAAQAMSGGLTAEPARSISPVPAASAPMLCGKKKRSVLNRPFDVGQTSLPQAQPSPILTGRGAQREQPQPPQSSQTKLLERHPNPFHQKSQSSKASTSQAVSGKGGAQALPNVQALQATPVPTDEKLIDPNRSNSKDKEEPGRLQIEQVNTEKPEPPVFTPGMKHIEMYALTKRYYQARTAWENRVQFNPQNSRDLEEVLKKIDEAKTVKDAQDYFKPFLGTNIEGDIGGEHMKDMNLRSVKLRLKGMARMVDDIPQLRGQVDEFYGLPDKDISIQMNANADPSQSQGGKSKKSIGWAGAEGSYMHGWSGRGNHHEERKRSREYKRAIKWNMASGRWTGTHELGHILHFMLDDKLRDSMGKVNDSTFTRDMQKDLIFHSQINAASVVQQAISELLTDPNFTEKETKEKLIRFVMKHTNDGEVTNDGEGSNDNTLTLEKLKARLEDLDLLDYSESKQLLISHNPELKDMLDKKETEYKKKLQGLFEAGLTSRYGAENISELFAEAFADYYGNGDNANALSKKIVEIAKARTAETKQENQTDKTDKPASLAPNQQEWVTKERDKLLKLISKPNSVP